MIKEFAQHPQRHWFVDMMKVEQRGEMKDVIVDVKAIKLREMMRWLPTYRGHPPMKFDLSLK